MRVTERVAWAARRLVKTWHSTMMVKTSGAHTVFSGDTKRGFVSLLLGKESGHGKEPILAGMQKMRHAHMLRPSNTLRQAQIVLRQHRCWTGDGAMMRLYQQRSSHHTLSQGKRGTGGTIAHRHAVPKSSTSLYRTMSAQAVKEVGGLRTLTEGLSDGQRKAIAWWLGGSAAWVFSMVVLGGVTRLTRSGLSMTDWKFTGEKPPQTDAEWREEFERYQLSPEFKRVNASMDLDEFKFIYWMEWAHRMWGRGLGVAFAIPCAYFALTGAITKPLASRLGLLFTMGGTQAFVGWWMVRSGLKEPDSPYEVPRVSPYRLASHLTSAFAIYALMVWTTLSVAFPKPLAQTITSPASLKAISKLRGIVHPFAGLLTITALSGAFVAGLDAGHAYNTFPLMNGQIVPDEYWKIPGWRNAFESTAAVQLHHRILAISTLLASLGLWKYGTAMPALPKSPRMLLHTLAIGAGIQVTLGVSTLLHYVPVSLGAAHQAGALALFTIALGLMHSLRSGNVSPVRNSLSKYGNSIAAAGVIGVGGACAFWE